MRRGLWLLAALLVLAPCTWAEHRWLDHTLGYLCLDGMGPEFDSALVEMSAAQGFLLDLRAWPGDADPLLTRLLGSANDQLDADRSNPLSRPWVILVDPEQTTLEDQLEARRLIRVYEVPRDTTYQCALPPNRVFRRAQSELARMARAEQKRAHDHLEGELRE